MKVLIHIWVVRFLYGVFFPLPVRNKVVLASSRTREPRGNLKAIHDGLLMREDPFSVVVLMHVKRPGLGGLLASLWAMIAATYHLATSRVFLIDDYYFPVYVVHPKRSTTIVQTWHASGAFKKMGYSVLDKSFGASEHLVRHVDIHSNYDYCLVASEESIPHYSEAFGQPAGVFVSLGIPRTDVFFNEQAQAHLVEAVRRRYGYPSDKRVILYAPTFRGKSAYEANYDDLLDLDLMYEYCSDECILLLRLHPFVTKRSHVNRRLNEFVFDVSDYPDINGLLLVSDVLVTDYSSVMYEFSLLERPMVFYAPDHAEYEAERGFYFDYKTGVPGPVFTRTDEVAKYLAEGEFDLSRVRAFRERAFDCADGKATERLIDQIIAPRMPC